MNIRNKLTWRFILIVAVIMLVGSVLIYVFSAGHREEAFYNRLQSRANNIAKLLIEVDEVDINLLRKIETDNPVSLPDEKVVIHDFRNNIVFSTDEAHVITIDSALLDRIRLEDEVRFKQGTYEVLGFLFKGPHDRFVVVAAATDIYGFSKLANLRAILLFVFAISILSVSVSGWFFAGQALHPISKVVRQVDEISITRLNLRVDEGNGKDELARLAQTFNRMLERLEASFQVQRHFIANASHELRTPLAAVTGQLEVALLNTRTNEEYQGILRSVLEDIRSLNSLSNHLLLLAQANADDTGRKLSRLRIDELVWQCRDELVKHDPAYVVRIDLDHRVEDESQLTIEGEEQLVKAALTNIMQNGCKYSSDHTTDVLIQPSPMGLTLTFHDRGIGIPQAELDHVFEPFYRGSNAQHILGHGIGLSMVQRIIQLHRGTIEVHSEENISTTITVEFPASLDVSR